jgi:ribonuclease BN (tRNA processing enzyme)
LRQRAPLACGARGAAERECLIMRVTIVGSGDAFGSGGRFNTCFYVETAKGTLMVDCGASSPVALNRLGLDHARVDAIILSHLHGDHFGGLPFLFLDAQFLRRRDRPLLVAGPPGTRERLNTLMETFFPLSTANEWRFALSIMEIEPGRPTDVVGHDVTTIEVVHPSGAPSTGIRLSDGKNLFAYSGDTEWTEALLTIAEGADLFIIECYSYAKKIAGHVNWETLKTRLPDLHARVMVTHMSPTVLARLDEIRAAGVEIAEDGKVIDL